MIAIAAIHGVNHSEEEQKLFHRWWQNALREAGLDVTVTGCPWSSLDSSIADWFASWRDPGTFAGHLEELEQQLAQWEFVTRGQARALVCHSWGTVLGYNLVLRMPELDGVPFVGLGTPFTHWWLGNRLRMGGRAEKWNERGRRPTFFCNEEDPICALRFLFGFRTTPAPKGSATRWIDIKVPEAERTGDFSEHDVTRYLQHPDVLTHLKAVSQPMVR